MKISTVDFKYAVHFSKKFKKDYKRVKKQGKDISKLKAVVKKLANGERLDVKYKNHNLMIKIITIVVSVI